MPELAAQTDQTTLDLESLTADVVALAMKAGASDAEAVVSGLWNARKPRFGQPVLEAHSGPAAIVSMSAFGAFLVNRS